MATLAWLVPIPPLIAFFAIILFLHRNKRLSSNVAIGSIGLSWLLGWILFFGGVFTDHFYEHPFVSRVEWLPTGLTAFFAGVMIDPLSAAMLFMVPFVCTLIFVYSHGYMTFPHHLPERENKDGLDPRYSRFFAYIALFATGMLGLVVSDNLLMLFIFWEIMGLCSYLLIGFWFEKRSAVRACIKAFLTTRVGDTFLFIGMLLLYVQVGSLRFSEIFQPEVLQRLATSTVGLPWVGEVAWATLISVLIFMGAVGKSAQFPLHVWLPDAMEGPTPVSALIHAATMVSAGVYLIIRMFPVMQAVDHGPALSFITFIGAFTALFAATIALAQNDIKRVLAFSTISQLGFMFAALGIGAYVAATFHLLTHAFFKALLFLGSGSVIHGMEHGVHHVAHHSKQGKHNDHAAHIDPQDMLNMGGLFEKMPRTAWTFIIGGLSLAGFPFITAGFWSKDEILADAWYHNHPVVFTTLAVAAFLTAFYTGRQIFLTFFGKPRTEAAAHAHESAPSMTVPLMVLAVFAIAGGWIGIPEAFPVLGPLLGNPFHDFIGHHAEALGIAADSLPFLAVPLLVSILVSLGGLGASYLVYGARPLQAGQADPLARALGPVYTLLHNKYYIDELYAATVIRFSVWLSEFLSRFDQSWVIDPLVNLVGWLGRVTAEVSRILDTYLVDGLVNGTGRVMDVCGRTLRLIQTGQVQNYLLVALVSVIMLLTLYLYG